MEQAKRILEDQASYARDVVSKKAQQLLSGDEGLFFATFHEAEIQSGLSSSSSFHQLCAMKRIIVQMCKSNDMAPFFPSVVKAIHTPSLELRRLIYFYIQHYAPECPQETLLSISAFQRDLTSPLPHIRAGGLRILASLRIAALQSVVVNALQKAAGDAAPMVRKAAAVGVFQAVWVGGQCKPGMSSDSTTTISGGGGRTSRQTPVVGGFRFYHPEASALKAILQTLLQDTVADVMGAAAMAFNRCAGLLCAATATEYAAASPSHPSDVDVESAEEKLLDDGKSGKKNKKQKKNDPDENASPLPPFSSTRDEIVSLLHPVYRQWCYSLLDCEEYGQLEMLVALTYYCRTQFHHPDHGYSHTKRSLLTTDSHRSARQGGSSAGVSTSLSSSSSSSEGSQRTSSPPSPVANANSDAEDEEEEEREAEAEACRRWRKEGGDPMKAVMERAAREARALPSDHALLLHAALPLLRALSPTPVLGVVALFYHCAPASFLLAYTIPPLLRVLRFYPEVKEVVLMMLCEISAVVEPPPATVGAAAAWDPHEGRHEDKKDETSSPPPPTNTKTKKKNSGPEDEAKQKAARYHHDVVWGQMYREAWRQSVASHVGLFYLSPDDTPAVMRLKLFLLPRLLSLSTARSILEEYQHYLTFRCLPSSSSFSALPPQSGTLLASAMKQDGTSSPTTPSRDEPIHAVLRSLAYLALDEPEDMSESENDQEEDEEEDKKKDHIVHEEEKKQKNRKKKERKRAEKHHPHHRHRRGNATPSQEEGGHLTERTHKRRAPFSYERDPSGHLLSDTVPLSSTHPYRSLPLPVRQLLLLRLVGPLVSHARGAGVVTEALYVLSLLVRCVGVEDAEAKKKRKREEEKGTVSTTRSSPVSSSRKDGFECLRKELCVFIGQLLRDGMIFFQFGGLAARKAAVDTKMHGEGEKEEEKKKREAEAEKREYTSSSSSPSPPPPPSRGASMPHMHLLLPSFVDRSEILSLVIWMIAEGIAWEMTIAAAAPDLFRLLVWEWLANGFASDDSGASVKKEILHLGSKIWQRMSSSLPSTAILKREEEEPMAMETPPCLPSLPEKFLALFQFAIQLGCNDRCVEVQEEARFLSAMQMAQEEEEEEEVSPPPPLSFSSSSIRAWRESMWEYMAGTRLSSLPRLSHPFASSLRGAHDPSSSSSFVGGESMNGGGPPPHSSSSSLSTPCGSDGVGSPPTFFLGSTAQCGHVATALSPGPYDGDVAGDHRHRSPTAAATASSWSSPFVHGNEAASSVSRLAAASSAMGTACPMLLLPPWRSPHVPPSPSSCRDPPVKTSARTEERTAPAHTHAWGGPHRPRHGGEESSSLSPSSSGSSWNGDSTSESDGSESSSGGSSSTTRSSSREESRSSSSSSRRPYQNEKNFYRDVDESDEESESSMDSSSKSASSSSSFDASSSSSSDK